MKHQNAKDAAELIIKILRERGHVAYLAGGCVRDLLLGHDPKDYDVVTDATPDRVVKLFQRTDKVGAKFGVVLVRLGGQQTEVATFRADGGYTDGRHPDTVVFGNEVDDAERRDFTINGMFYDLAEDRVIDHVGGRQDLQAGVIRAIGDPQGRFAEDHLRMLRAVRFAARLAFTIDPATFEGIRAHAPRLGTISAERIREELRLILTHPSRVEGWRLLVASGLADHLIQDVIWSQNESSAAGARLAAFTDKVGFTPALAALLWCRAPADAQRACRRLTCTNAETRGVGWLLTQLPRVREPDGLQLADVKLLMAGGRFDDLTELLLADLVGSCSSLAPHAALLKRCRAIAADEVAPPPLVTGDDLITRRIPQGPAYATILDAIYRAQLNNEINGRQAALDMLNDLIHRTSC